MQDPVTRRGFVGTVAFSPLAGGLAAGSVGSAEETSNPLRDEHSGAGQTLRLPASYYQQFDADWTREIPAEGYGGWRSAEVEFSRNHTALVVMHAWDCGRREDYPGWYRAVEYIPRANAICEQVFPPLLGAVRDHGFRMFHVVGGGDYYKNCPGYRMARELAGDSPRPLEQVKSDPHLNRLRRFRAENVFVGKRNAEDVKCGSARIDFAPQARPRNDEGVAEDGHQLFALCKHFGVNHLVYAGFAINWCLLMSPGGHARDVAAGHHVLGPSTGRDRRGEQGNRPPRARQENRSMAGSPRLRVHCQRRRLRRRDRPTGSTGASGEPFMRTPLPPLTARPLGRRRAGDRHQ